MAHLAFISFLVLLNTALSFGTEPIPTEGIPSLTERNRYCNLYGVVYIEESPGLADFRVYEEETEAFSTLLVYEEDNRLYADREGIWCFTDDRNLADFTVYFSERRKGTQFSVYFIDTESFAGCNQ